MPDAALVAVTEQVAAPVALSAVPVTEQLVPVTANVTAPEPEPPVEVNVIGVPDVPDVEVLLTVKVA